MRSNFGWQIVLTRSLSVAAFLTCAAAAWGQTTNSKKLEPPATGNVPQVSDPGTANGMQTRPSAEINGANAEEATGLGSVLGSHFEHGMRGSQQEMKITKVDPNGPASRAGLQPNDRIVSVDGRSFANHRQLIAYLSVLGGRPVSIVFERNGREMSAQLVPGQFQGDHAWLGVLLDEDRNGPNPTFQNQNDQRVPEPNQSAPNSPRSARTPGAADKNAANEKGAEISQVYPNGPAARAGLRPGDVIIQVNGTKVEDAGELIALVHEMKPQTQAEMQILRDNKELKVPVTLGNRNQEYTAQFGPNQFGAGQGGPQPFGAGQWQGNGQFGPGQYGPGQFQGGQFGGPFPQGPGWQGQMGFNPNDQQLTQQNQRIEDELKQLREEIKQLREQLQKK
jgi:hypothetical protein